MLIKKQKIQIKTLEQAVLATLCWFDVMEYPLTVAEVARYLYWPKHVRPVTLEAIEDALTGDYLAARVAQQNGMYYLNGHDNFIKTRAERHNITIPYWKRAKKVARWLSLVPFVDSLALCNLFALSNKKTTSDIDTFIVVRDGRLWTARFFATGVAMAMGQWRHGSNVAGKICLSFYLTDSELSIEELSARPYDLYLRYWIATLAWIMEGERSEQFMLANSWIASDFPNYFPRKEVQLHVAHSRVARVVRAVSEKILGGGLGNALESSLRRLQMNKMEPAVFHKEDVAGEGVVVNDHMLKFHEEDRRAYFRNEFERRYVALSFEPKLVIRSPLVRTKEVTK